MKKNWYERAGWIIFFLIFFFPVGLFLTWKYSDWNKNTKIILTVVIIVLSVVSFLVPDVDSTEQPGPDIVEPATNATIDLFSEIINAKDHPQFHGSLSKAKETWYSYSKNVHIDSYSSYNDDTLLTISGIKDEDIINNIEFYPLNASKNLSVDEALSIAYDFINASFINEAYSAPETYIVKREQNNVYVLQYTLTDAGRELYKDIYISGRVVILVEEENGIVYNMRITTDTPRWFVAKDRNYIKEEWIPDSPLMKIGISAQ